MSLQFVLAFTDLISKNVMKNLSLILSTIILAFTGQIAFSQSPCTHTLNLFDSYGDGWNGGYLTVTVDGSALPAQTLGSGTAGTYGFTAGDGSDIDVTWSTNGSWASERSWTIVDGEGNEIGAGNGSGSWNDLAGNCPPPPAPGCASNLSPATSASNISILPTLTWDATSGATSYDVYFGASSGGLSLVSNDQAVTRVICLLNLHLNQRSY